MKITTVNIRNVCGRLDASHYIPEHRFEECVGRDELRRVKKVLTAKHNAEFALELEREVERIREKYKPQ